jgi:membrane protein implicated in regulation of membrane protease activity
MFIILPIIIMFLTATTLIILRFMRPTFKYPWLVAAAGAIFGFASIFIWQIDLPQRVSLDAWQPVTHFNYL